MTSELAHAPYRDPSRTIAERASDLLGRMTLDEKLAQIAGVWPPAIVDGNFSEEKARAAMPHGIGHISHISAVLALAPRDLARVINAAQRFLIEQTRLGIPAIVHGESCAGFTARGATCFPQAIGLASTWEPELIEEMTSVIRQQMLAAGVRQSLAPVLDIARDGRWGRVEETYGEDPYLAGRIGVAYVRGLQGPDLRDGIAATGKHFLGYGASEGGMNWAPVHLGQREILDVYARPFEAAIREAGLASIMNAYSEIDGVPCGASREVLTDLLRDRLGFDGVVVSDYFTVATLRSYHRLTPDKGEAARRALDAGLDVELPFADCFGEPLRAAVVAGTVAESLIDRAVERVLRMKFALGLFERPYVDEDAAPAAFDTAQHRSLARRIARKSMVLLKNDGALLPLSRGARTIAVIGPCADSRRLLQGDYHYPTHLEVMFGPIREPGDEVTPQAASPTALTPGAHADLAEHFVPHVTVLDGIRSHGAEATTVTYARGCDVTGDERGQFPAAIEAARIADVAILCVGGKSGLIDGCTSGESNDRAGLDLPGVQQELVDAVLATGTPVVVVLINGGVLSILALAERVPAILEAWLPGEEGGNAIADVLFGDVNPAGRLPLSLPRSVGQVPLFYGHKPSGGRSNWRGNYVDQPSTPLFPFGHGLSYTTFEYGDLAVSATAMPATARIDVSVSVTNTGDRAGEDVVQLYLHDLDASVTRPVKQLAGFKRIALAAGQCSTLTFQVDLSQIAFHDDAMQFVVEPGPLEVMVGASSEDIRGRAIVEITGEKRRVRREDITPTSVDLR
jgi:beta-glucosidase